MPGTHVRDARPSDCEVAAGLLTELGYPVSPERLGRRLQVLSGERSTRVFVAESDGAVCGLAAMQVMHLLERDDPVCRLTALVVAPETRRRGVGSALLARIDREARSRACVRMEVTTAEEREDAADFYVRVGFEERPRRFVLELRA